MRDSFDKQEFKYQVFPDPLYGLDDVGRTLGGSARW
jgi:hypothetical protein